MRSQQFDVETALSIQSLSCQITVAEEKERIDLVEGFFAKPF